MNGRRDANRPEAAAGGDSRLARLQTEFAAHIRAPDRNPAPADVEDRRMAIYRRLFFNNIRSLLEKNFPVLRSLYDEAGWSDLVRDFYSGHRCRTPLFPELAKEFLRYLQDVRPGQEPGAGDDPPFLLELAHYEWVELALTLDERELEDFPADVDADLTEGRPLLSPLTWILSYRFPVHRIRRDFQPQEAPTEATHLLVYRDRAYRVRFMTLNAVTRLLLEHLRNSPEASGRELLERVAAEIRHPDPAKVIAAGSAVLNDLRDRDVLLGTRPGA
jgi:hypothetical protein